MLKKGEVNRALYVILTAKADSYKGIKIART